MATIINDGILEGVLTSPIEDSTIINTSNGSVQGITSSLGNNYIENNGYCFGQLNGVRGNNIIVNTGEITADVTLGEGKNKFTNTGKAKVISGIGDTYISNTGNISEGIYAVDGNDYVDNSGSINKVYVGNGDNVVVNSGTITDSISAEDGNNKIYNSGTVSSIELGNGNNTIKNSKTIESIKLGTGDNFVVINEGFTNVSITFAERGNCNLRPLAETKYYLYFDKSVENLVFYKVINDLKIEQRAGSAIVIESYFNLTRDIKINDRKVADLIKDNLVEDSFTLTVETNLVDATCELSYNGTTYRVNELTVPYGTIVEYNIYREGYSSKKGSWIIDSNVTKYVALTANSYTLTVDTNPKSATCEMTYDGETYEAKSVTVPYGTTVSCRTFADGFAEDTSEWEVTESMTRRVSLAAYNYTLNVTTNPADAECKLTYNGATHTARTATVPYGTTVFYEVSSEGFATKSGSWVVSGDETREVNLATAQVHLVVETSPADAKCELIYGGSIHESNTAVVDYDTEITCRVSKDGYETSEELVVVKGDVTKTVLLAPKNYKLTIFTEPTNADCTLKYNGKTYINTKELESVPFDTLVYYTVSAEGYNEASGNIKIEGKTEKTVTLEKKAYTLTVEVTPANAICKLSTDGGTTWETTNEVRVPYKTVVMYEVLDPENRYKTKTGSLSVTKDETKVVDLTQVSTVTLTVNTIPEEATCILVDNNNADNKTSNKCIEVLSGSTVYCEVSCEGYETHINNLSITEDYISYITLSKLKCNLTIDTIPLDAKCELKYEDSTHESKTAIVDYGTKVEYTVSYEGFSPISDSLIVTGYPEQKQQVNLMDNYVTLNVTTEPDNAQCDLTYNGTTQMNCKSLSVLKNSKVDYYIHYAGYKEERGTWIMNNSADKTVQLKPSKLVTLAVNVIPDDVGAICFLAVENEPEQQIDTIEVEAGTTVNYRIQPPSEYGVRRGSWIVNETRTETINLNDDKCTLKIKPIPVDSKCEMSTDNGSTWITTDSITVKMDSPQIKYRVSHEGYITEENYVIMQGNKEKTVELEEVKCTLTVNTDPYDATCDLYLLDKDNNTLQSFPNEKSIEIPYGSRIGCKVTCTGYADFDNQINKEDIWVIKEDTIESVNLNMLAYDFELDVQPNTIESTCKITYNGKTYTTNLVTVPYGTDVSYEVTADGYIPRKGKLCIKGKVTKTIQINSSKMTLTVKTIPENASCTLSYGGASSPYKSITVDCGTEVFYDVSMSATGDKYRSGSWIVTDDMEKVVNLNIDTVTFEVLSTIPEKAMCLINGKERRSITVSLNDNNNEITYEVSADGYVTETNTFKLFGDTTKIIELEEELEGNWSYDTSVLPEKELLYKYLNSSATSITVPKRKGKAVVNYYLDSTSDNKVPFYNNQNIISAYLKNVPFRDSSMYRAFYNCCNLKTVEGIPTSVTNMSGSFQGCTNFNYNVQIPDSVIDMTNTFSSAYDRELPKHDSISPEGKYLSGSMIFNQNVKIPNGVKELVNTFRFCCNLDQNIQIPDRVTSMANTFYACSSLNQGIKIPDSVTNMSQTFYGCINLDKNINIPANVADIDGLFAECSSLNQGIKISHLKLNTLSNVFYNCTNLNQNIQIPAEPNSSKGYSMNGTFKGCSGLRQNIKVPNSVTYLKETFMGCSSINDITILSANISIADGCFTGINNGNTNVYIPKLYINGVNTKTYNTLAKLKWTIAGTGTYVGPAGSKVRGWDLIGGDWTYTGDGSKWVLSKWKGNMSGGSHPSVSVPRAVTTYDTFDTVITNACFYANKTLTSVDCNSVPFNGITGYRAFYGCTGLATVSNMNIPSSVTRIDGMFQTCSNLKSVSSVGSIANNGEVNITIPNSVTTLASMFLGCKNINSFNIRGGAGVTTIATMFSGCNTQPLNIRIECPNLATVSTAFASYNGSFKKNVGIYFNYKNGEATATYKALQTAFFKGSSEASNAKMNLYFYNIGECPV